MMNAKIKLPRANGTARRIITERQLPMLSRIPTRGAPITYAKEVDATITPIALPLFSIGQYSPINEYDIAVTIDMPEPTPIFEINTKSKLGAKKQTTPPPATMPEIEPTAATKLAVPTGI